MAKNNNNKIFIGIIVVFALVVIGLFVFFLNQGSTTTTGTYPNDVANDTIKCTGKDIDYPIFTYYNATRSNVEVNIISSENKAKSIALTYTLYYNDNSDVVASEAHNHAAMNVNFGRDRLGTDALSANYAKLDGKMRMSLYLNEPDINTTTLKYFFVDTDNNYIPTTLMEYKTIYENKGMECKKI